MNDPKRTLDLQVDAVIENEVNTYIEQKHQVEEEEPDYADHNEF